MLKRVGDAIRTALRGEDVAARDARMYEAKRRGKYQVFAGEAGSS